MSKTAWDVYSAVKKYDGSPTAHEDVVNTLQKHGHHAKMSAAWCTMTVMAMLYDAGAIDCIGGYSQISGEARKKAKAKKLFHDGSSGILPFDHVIYGDKSGKPNHSEIAIGKDLNVSGNYNKACNRRKRSGRRIIGYTRPKYSACANFNNLQVTILAAETLLGTYGTGNDREKNLSVFGKDNAAKVLQEVERIYHSTDQTIFAIAVYAIQGFAGKDPHRKKRLGSWADSVQKKINSIDALKGKTVAEAAQDVLAGKYGTNAIRSALLAFNGYDAAKVQAEVNKALEAKPAPIKGTSASIISLFRDAPRQTKDVDGLQGDCVIVKYNKKALIMDTYKAGVLDKIYAEIADCTDVWLYGSHIHSDHMGKNANALIKSGKVSTLLLPERKTINSEYLARYDKLIADANKYGVKVVNIRQGATFCLSGIKGKVLFQQEHPSTDSVNMKSLCTLITVNGRTMLTCGDHHCGTKESDFEYTEHVDIYKSSHHRLYTGDREQFIANISPDYVIGSGWKCWGLGTVGEDPKTKRADKAYQKYANFLPGDVCGRTEFVIGADSVIEVKGEKNMTGRTITYTLNGKTYHKTVHVCERTTFHRVNSMLPAGAKFV